VVVDSTTITATTAVMSGAQVSDLRVQNLSANQSAILEEAFTFGKTVILSVTPANGSINGGVVVRLLGSGFVSGTTVTFDGIAGTNVTVIDGEHITVTTPAHALGFTDVVITKPDLTTATFKNGFQYTSLVRGSDIRRNPGIVINDALNNAPNTCSFVIDRAGSEPLLGEQVEIKDAFDGNRLLFAGLVTRKELMYEELTTNWKWNVSATDWTFLFNRFRPFAQYIDQSVSDVVKDLVARYAPGFTSLNVQTNLARVSITFDGNQDLATCLSTLAEMIGEGHWYIDYTRDVHFFHIKFPEIQLPFSTPNTAIGSAMSVAEGSSIPAVFSFASGYYIFQHSFFYSDGSESSLRACSSPIFCSGTKILSFTNVPLGTSIGAVTCVARRIYYRRLLPTTRNLSGHSVESSAGEGIETPVTNVEEALKFAQLNDNATTDFTTWFGSLGASSAVVIDIPDSSLIPSRAYNGHRPAPASPPSVSLDIVSGALLWNGSSVAFKMAYLYRDASISLTSAPSNVATKTLIQGEGIKGYNLSSILVGPSSGDVDVIGRIFYFGVAAPGDDPVTAAKWNTHGVVFLPDNTSTQLNQFSLASLGLTAADLPSMAFVYPGLVVGRGTLMYDTTRRKRERTALPPWPNQDGPNPEDSLPVPDEINDTNPYLLKDPSFIYTSDWSQIRNRIYVIGVGTTIVGYHAVGSTVLTVNDVSKFDLSGGQLVVMGQRISYSSISEFEDENQIFLTSPTTKGISDGSEVNIFYQADDLASQEMVRKIEVDSVGKPTNGVHEYTIKNTQFTTVFELYMAAYAELERFKKPLGYISYASRDPKHRSGAKVKVNLTNPPCVGEFLIQEVMIDQIHDDADLLAPRYNVRADSAARYTFNDFLLELDSRRSSSSAVSFSGVVSSDGTSSEERTRSGYGYPCLTNSTTANSFLAVPTGSGAISVGSSSLVGGQVTGKTDRDGQWMLAGIGTTGAANAAGAITISMSAPGLRFKCRWLLRMPTRAEMDLDRTAAGSSTPNPAINFGVGIGVAGMGIGQPTARGVYVCLNGAHANVGYRRSWLIRTIDGSGTVEQPVLNAAQDTIYDITVEESDGSNFLVTINGAQTKVGISFLEADVFFLTSQISSNLVSVNSLMWVQRVEWESD